MFSFKEKISLRTGTRRFLGSRALFSSALLLLFLPSTSFATPSIDEIENEIREFQHFFQSRFPTVPLKSYQNGVNALPQYSHRLKNWEILSSNHQHINDMNRIRAKWIEPFADGATLAECFAEKPSGNHYPYYDGYAIKTIVGDITQCLNTHGEPILDPASAQMAKLVAYFKSQSNGQPIVIDYSSEPMREAYEKGRQFYWARRGQLNFSCASCHVHNAGNQLRSDVIGPGLGQTSGFPIYRTKWALEGQPWGTIHRRYAACNIQAGAAPLPLQSDQYIALEVYQTILDSGIPLRVPGRRQ